MDIVNRAEIPEGTRLVERELFRDVIGHFASGVTVITTRDEEINYGLTASAVSSLSLDPPMVLVCINKRTGTPKVISKVKVFAVNILRKTNRRSHGNSRPLTPTSSGKSPWHSENLGFPFYPICLPRLSVVW